MIPKKNGTEEIKSSPSIDAWYKITPEIEIIYEEKRDENLENFNNLEKKYIPKNIIIHEKKENIPNILLGNLKSIKNKYKKLVLLYRLNILQNSNILICLLGNKVPEEI